MTDPKMLWEQMISLAENFKDDELKALYAQSGLTISLKTEDKIVWEPGDDGVNYASVTQTCSLLLGDVEADNWTRTIVGYYGCMGTGWWQEVLEDSSDYDTVYVLELLEIDIPEVEVPEPEPIEEDDE